MSILIPDVNIKTITDERGMWVEINREGDPTIHWNDWYADVESISFVEAHIQFWTSKGNGLATLVGLREDRASESIEKMVRSSILHLIKVGLIKETSGTPKYQHTGLTASEARPYDEDGCLFV